MAQNPYMLERGRHKKKKETRTNQIEEQHNYSRSAVNVHKYIQIFHI